MIAWLARLVRIDWTGFLVEKDRMTVLHVRPFEFRDHERWARIVDEP